MSIFGKRQKDACKLAQEVAQVSDQQRAMQALRYLGCSSWLFNATQEELQQATTEELEQAINNLLTGQPVIRRKEGQE